MNKILEQAFTERASALFGLVEAYYDTQDVIGDYRQGKGSINGKLAKNMPEAEIKECTDELEQEKQEFAEQIKGCIIDVDFSQMFNEIMANLDEPMSEQQRERYCFSLITPFEPYSTTLCPDVLLRKSQDSIKSLQGVDGAERMMAMFQQQIEDAQNKAQRYFDMAFTAEALESKDKVQLVFMSLAHLITEYANMLDAAFVLHGLDLKELQNRCGVWIKQFIGGKAENPSRAFEISTYIGSTTLAEEYISKLKPQPDKADNEQTTDAQSLNPGPQPKDLHYYCEKAIEKGYLIRVGGSYKRVNGQWTKAMLAYFLKHFPVPEFDKVYCPMFTETRLSKAASQLLDNKHGDGKPLGYEKIDALLQE